MILVDTSVWVDHMRRGSERLSALLAELAEARTATHGETITLVDEHRLAGSGIGWIDAHLLASARLSGCGLWTADKALERAAEAVGVAR